MSLSFARPSDVRVCLVFAGFNLAMSWQTEPAHTPHLAIARRRAAVAALWRALDMQSKKFTRPAAT